MERNKNTGKKIQAAPAIAADAYCRQTLKRVSRTFAINIALLRGDLHRAILCAYLFCRIADTVEDAVFSNPGLQLELLQQYRDIFVRHAFSRAGIAAWIRGFRQAGTLEHISADDCDLALHLDRVVENYLTLPERYRQAICDCLVEMTSGMLETVSLRTQRASLYFPKTIADLNTYCYYVAGTVGILLTRLFSVHSRAITQKISDALSQLAVSFGLGLQMTNIIKDCRRDFVRGCCYIPEELARANGLHGEELFEPASRPQAQKTINAMILRAANHLDDALDYILQIPRRDYRIRLFCSLPLFFAINTLIAAKDNHALLAGKKVKISRAEVKNLIRVTSLMCWSNRALAQYYRRFRLQLTNAPAR